MNNIYTCTDYTRILTAMQDTKFTLSSEYKFRFFNRSTEKFNLGVCELTNKVRCLVPTSGTYFICFDLDGLVNIHTTQPWYDSYYWTSDTGITLGKYEAPVDRSKCVIANKISNCNSLLHYNRERALNAVSW